MVREIMRDPIFLSRASEQATSENLQVAQNLLDTLEANKTGCVGMAANMIGVSRGGLLVFQWNPNNQTLSFY